MPKVYLRSANEAIFEDDNEARRELVKGLTDGYKLRLEPRIAFPVKALTQISKLGDGWWKMMSPEALKKTKEVSEGLKFKKQKISEIRSAYASQTIEGIPYEFKCKYPPLKHQLTMFRAMIEMENAALLADPGTCKTGAYLWGIDYRIRHGVKKCLIITLSHLKENVLEEMKIQVPELRGVILEGKLRSDMILNKKYKHAKKNMDYDVYIANYESMFTLIDLFSNDYFQMVVLDEAHRVGSPKSNQTKAVVGKFESIPYKYIVTGTLNANNERSFFMPFRFMGADLVPECDYYEFRRRHFYTVDPEQHIWVASPGVKDLVSKLIGNVSVCFKKEECTDLPPRIYEQFRCDMSAAQQEEYDRAVHEMMFIVKKHCQDCLKMVQPVTMYVTAPFSLRTCWCKLPSWLR